MDRSQVFSSKSTNGSAHAFPYTENDEVSLDYACEQKSLSMKRLEDFFSKEELKFNSPHTCGRTTKRSATENMQKQLQAFDEEFNIKGSATEEQARK
ncbi:hypothetical protein L207DRAFT_590066 [Hyaloscypha variabilis F]|uniref:Uncharacterized protein n=1 Tax=Hyaloscypha variabilis (strain UAMH 11265 / GT02V1 / F) TaxID=1149755 RepID=A0A2J6R399_HYAVF|nr:hypothetical protein L207DRAFT_590066 [Hyaloscypha variabilis F]